MGVLDDLKQQAQRLKAEEARAAEARAQRLTDAREVIAPAMRQIHAYLKELTDQLTVVHPEIVVNFRIRDVGAMEGLLQRDYRLSTEGAEESLDSVTLACSLESQRHYRYDINVPGQVENWLNELKRHGLKLDHAQVLEESSVGHRVWINVAGHVPVHLRFAVDLENGSIVLSVHNYEELGRMRHRIRPDQVNEHFLDELGRYVLRRPNRFLRFEVPAEMRDRLRKRIEEDQKRKQDELGGAMGALSTRIRSLFKRRYVLQLRYDGKTYRTDDEAEPLVLGRGDNCELVVNGKHVSRRHARIEFRLGEFVLIDESRNGTYVTTPERENVHLHREEIVLTGSGVISLGARVDADAAHLIHYSL